MAGAPSVFGGAGDWSSTEARTFAAMVRSPTERRLEEVFTEADLRKIDDLRPSTSFSRSMSLWANIGNLLRGAYV